MRTGAILINTARGGCVDNAALLDGLESGKIGFAGLDVVEVEPLADARLRDHPRVLVSPHSAFYSVEGFVELRSKTAKEVRRILLGEQPRNPVNTPSPRTRPD
jgi:phosphoglycerate dehydrogenase-like enzyme